MNDSSLIISRLAAEVAAAGGGKASGGGKSGGGGKAEGGLLASLFGGVGKAAAAGGKGQGALGPASREEEEKWRRWVDDWFVKVGAAACGGKCGVGRLPATKLECEAAALRCCGALLIAGPASLHLHLPSQPAHLPATWRQVITVNIYRNMGEAFQTFDYISQRANWGWATREAGEWPAAPAGQPGTVCRRQRRRRRASSAAAAPQPIPNLSSPAPFAARSPTAACPPACHCRSARGGRHDDVGHQRPPAQEVWGGGRRAAELVPGACGDLRVPVRGVVWRDPGWQPACRAAASHSCCVSLRGRCSARPPVDPFDPALPARRPQSADEWVGALGGRRFMGGDAPDLADLAMFGVVRAVAGTNTFNDLMQVGCRVLGRWAGGRAGRAAAWQAARRPTAAPAPPPSSPPPCCAPASELCHRRLVRTHD